MKQTWIVLLTFALVLGVASCIQGKGPHTTGKDSTGAPPAAKKALEKDDLHQTGVPSPASRESLENRDLITEEPVQRDLIIEEEPVQPVEMIDVDKEMIDVDIPPQPLKPVIPKYPESARAKGIEGMVYVKALVGTDGIVRTAEIIKSGGGVPELEQSALEAAQAMKFAPAKKGGKAVAVWVTIPFRFALQKSGGEKLLSELKHPKDPVYVEGYLEGLRDSERQLQGKLDALRAQNADTKEIEQTLQRLKTKISALQAHLDKLKGEKPMR